MKQYNAAIIRPKKPGFWILTIAIKEKNITYVIDICDGTLPQTFTRSENYISACLSSKSLFTVEPISVKAARELVSEYML